MAPIFGQGPPAPPPYSGLPVCRPSAPATFRIQQGRATTPWRPTWVENQEELLPVILIHPYGQVTITRTLLLLGGIIGKGNLSSQDTITKILLLPWGVIGQGDLKGGACSSSGPLL